MQLLEICGLAGAGKSTIYELLCQNSNGNSLYYGYHSSKGHKNTRLISHIFRLLPILPWVGIDGLTGKRFKMLLKLETLFIEYGLYKNDSPGYLVIDQGPVYIHALFRGRWNAHKINDSFDRWLRTDLRRWACVLDRIIWLDVSSEFILERALARTKSHTLKRVNDQDRDIFIERYSKAYSQILGEFAHLGVTISAIKTDHMSPTETVDLLRKIIS